MLLEGLFLPLTTPFLPSGRLNLPKLRDNVVRYSKTPAAGLVALSRIGQPSLLSDSETEELLRCVSDAASAEKVLLAGVARDSVLHTLRLIESAAEMGYDAALVPKPLTLQGDSSLEETLTYFNAIADSAVLPVILDSGLTDHAIAAEVVYQAAMHRKIIGMVDAAAEIERLMSICENLSNLRREVTVTPIFAAVTGRMIAKHRPMAGTLVSSNALSSGGSAMAVAPSSVSTLKTRTKAVGFQILCGRTSGILEALSAGASGAMSPLAASAPQACYEVLAAWKDGDPALAAEKQERVRKAAWAVEEALGTSGIKYAGDLNGYFGGRPRLPSLPLSRMERAQVEVAMAGLRN